MKKKILLISLMVAMLVCLFAVSVSARTDYREEQTYNYYDTNGNLLYSATTIYAIDSDSNYKGKYRYEVIIRESGEGFAKFDANGTPLTWYVTSDDAKDQKIGSASAETDGVINITVTSTPTIGGVVGNIDKNKKYVYSNDSNNVSYSKKVVSANFFGTGVKTFDKSVFLQNASVAPSGSTSEYSKLTDGSYLLCLYLPETLTSIQGDLCQRSPLRVLEFENSKVSFTGAMPNAFRFCANLKKLVIPEGITSLPAEVFRECLSISYVKLSSTVTRVENDAFRRASGIETFIMGENVEYCGILTDEIGRFHVEENRADCVKIKYFYISPKINTSGKFDSYRQGSTGSVGDLKNVIFFIPLNLEKATVIANNYATDSLKVTVDEARAKQLGMTYNEPISYETYIANKEYYDTQITHHLLVYNVPYCVAFYDGNHDIESKNTYKDVLTSFEMGDACKNCGEGDLAKYAPVIEFKGYSAKINGDRITLGYKVNKESLALFPELSYGILATVPGVGADLNALEPLNADLTTNGDDYVITMEVDKKYSDFNIFIESFEADYYETPFVMCVYITDGENVDYLCYNDGKIVQSEYAQAFTYKFVAEEFSPKFQVTFTCDSKMGTISGETTQIVAEGNNTTEVTAVANDGYTFIGWSDGTRTAKITYKPEDAANLVAYFTHASTDTEETKGLPVIEINTLNGLSITSKDVYTDCYISLLDTETGNNVVSELAEIKGRGNSTWDKFDKKPYKFKFESKQNLFNYGAEKTWVLLADARDYSLLRNMLALNAGGVMSELGYTSKGQSVELYLNGEYQGVYYLCEQIQIKENRVNITQEDDKIVQGPADIGYLIEMDAWVSEDVGGTNNIPQYGVTSDGDVFVRVDDGMYNGYVIKDPEDILYNEDKTLKEEFMLYIQAYIKNSLAAVSGDDYNAVCELIDVKSFAQAYIIFDLFKNPDTQYSSVYFYKDVDGKLVAAPLWDFDMSIGNVTHKKNCGTNAQNFRDTTYLWTAQKNTWFRELLEFQEFRDLVGQELVNNAAALRASIAADLEYAKAHKAAYEKNFEVWNLIGNTGASEKMGNWSVPDEFKKYATWEEHLDYIKGYLEASLQNLLKVYPAPAVSEQ